MRCVISCHFWALFSIWKQNLLFIRWIYMCGRPTTEVMISGQLYPSYFSIWNLLVHTDYLYEQPLLGNNFAPFSMEQFHVIITTASERVFIDTYQIFVDEKAISIIGVFNGTISCHHNNSFWKSIHWYLPNFGGWKSDIDNKNQTSCSWRVVFKVWKYSSMHATVNCVCIYILYLQNIVYCLFMK